MNKITSPMDNSKVFLKYGDDWKTDTLSYSNTIMPALKEFCGKRYARTFALYHELLFHMQKQSNNTPWTNYAFLAKGLNCGRDTIAPHMKLLLGIGLVEKIEERNPKGQFKKGFYKINRYVNQQKKGTPVRGLPGPGLTPYLNTQILILPKDNINTNIGKENTHTPKGEGLTLSQKKNGFTSHEGTWDESMGCYQYPDLPMNLQRSNPGKWIHTDTSSVKTDTPKKPSKAAISPPKNARTHRLGVKLAGYIKDADQLHPKTRIEEFGIQIDLMARNDDIGVKGNYAKKVDHIAKVIKEYQPFIGVKYMIEANAPTSFRKRFFDIKKRIKIMENDKKDLNTPANGYDGTIDRTGKW